MYNLSLKNIIIEFNQFNIQGGIANLRNIQISKNTLILKIYEANLTFGQDFITLSLFGEGYYGKLILLDVDGLEEIGILKGGEKVLFI